MEGPPPPHGNSSEGPIPRPMPEERAGHPSFWGQSHIAYGTARGNSSWGPGRRRSRPRLRGEGGNKAWQSKRGKQKQWGGVGKPTPARESQVQERNTSQIHTWTQPAPSSKAPPSPGQLRAQAVLSQWPLLSVDLEAPRAKEKKRTKKGRGEYPPPVSSPSARSPSPPHPPTPPCNQKTWPSRITESGPRR